MISVIENIARVNQDRISIAAGGSISVIETSKDGEGEVVFKSKTKNLIRFHGYSQPPIRWASCLNCADGSIIVENGTEFDLFIVELKTTLTPSELKKSCKQLSGGYINALAISGVLGIQKFSNVYCVVSYEREKISEILLANPSLIKSEKDLNGTGVTEWIRKKIHVPTLGDCDLFLNLRDSNTGIGEFILD